ncbi:MULTISPECIES: hypothetical protein [Herbaspirillum]|uniref:hypothetical protein n=1 Tax=Herbaspirillum TaxID=963 RepID=UPI0012E0EFBE|nr:MULTISPECIES: hypothetical protein [Herbaspirillum]MDR6396331.1 hypothetical protein [Herbaspirillum seropedicae]UMU20603.1 hypothetical protein G5B88_05205 [Herbaspirillum seropedicae]
MFFDTVSRIDEPAPSRRPLSSRLGQASRNFDIVCDLFFIIPYRRAVIASA